MNTGQEQSRVQNLRTWADATMASHRPDPTLRLAAGDRPGIVRHPFKLASREDYLRQVRGAGIFKRAEEAKIQDVPLKEIWGLQRHVNVERLQAHYDNPSLIPLGTRSSGHGGLTDMPTFTKVGGKLYVHDGHHRAAAAHLKGAQSIRARVVDLDASGWSSSSQVSVNPEIDPRNHSGL